MKKLLLPLMLLVVLCAGCKKGNEPVPEPEICKDVCGNSYKTVTIGKQIWMAENLKCNKYAAGSEAYKAGITGEIPTSKKDVTAAYVIDPRNKDSWDPETNHGDNLSDAQIASFGLLYNWAAAVGLADGATQTTDFTMTRQGICPDGWHLPTLKDCDDLIIFIENTDGKGKMTAGLHLKSASGWNTGSDGNGDDAYGFNAVPTGYGSLGLAYAVGSGSNFWLSTIDSKDKSQGVSMALYFADKYITESPTNKYFAGSVRCLKNN